MTWWNSLFRKNVRDAQLDSELRFHIEELADANIAAGMSPQEARRQAQLEFGGREQIKEELRDIYRVRIVDSAAANLKSAFRFLRKSPSFSITVILTFALGIGANSAVFSAIDAILLRPLPFPNGDQLAAISQFNPKIQSPTIFVAPIRVEDWNRMNSTFQAITGYDTEDASENLTLSFRPATHGYHGLPALARPCADHVEVKKSRWIVDVALRGTLGAKVGGYFRMLAFFGNRQCRFAVVGLGIDVRAVDQQVFHDFEMSVCGGGEQRCVAGAVAVIGIGAVFQQPDGGLLVAVGDRAGDGIVTGAVGGGGGDVSALFEKIADDGEVAESGGQGDGWKTVWRVTAGKIGFFLDEVFH